MKQIPLLLTLARLVLGIFFPFLREDLWLPVLLAGLLTEFLDGFLARRFHWTTLAGQMLDPVADKIFVLCVAGTFLAREIISIRDLLLLAVRDLTVIAGLLISAAIGRWKHIREITPAVPGKIATVFQFVLLGGVAIWKRPEPWLLYPTFAAGLIAAADYARRYRGVLFSSLNRANGAARRR